MPRVKELFELARNYYAQANGTTNPDAKRAMRELGDKYLMEAEELRRNQIVQAVFPKSNGKIG